MIDLYFWTTPNGYKPLATSNPYCLFLCKKMTRIEMLSSNRRHEDIVNKINVNT